MARRKLRSALDSVLGIDAPQRVLRDLHMSIERMRGNAARTSAHTPLRRLLHAVASAGAAGAVFRQLRTAAAKSGSRTR